MSGRTVGVALCLAALIVYLAASSVYIVNEGEQALVVRLGAPIGVADKPGLKFKAPFIDSVYVDLDPLASARAAARTGDHGR